MNVFVDTSVWIDYFRNTGRAEVVELLIEENLVVTNEMILAELIPFLNQRKEFTLVALLGEITRQPISINWDEIIRFQTNCLKHGVNGIGIPDLIIAQNAMQGKLKLLSNDKHFISVSKLCGLELYLGT